jgi:uncharacterized protein (UPF0333 family)
MFICLVRLVILYYDKKGKLSKENILSPVVFVLIVIMGGLWARMAQTPDLINASDGVKGKK